MSRSKHGYYTHRNKALSNVSERQSLGEREIVTLETIAGANQGNQWQGKHVVDLGCGDQYIRHALERRGANYIGVDIDQCNLETDEIPVFNS